MTVESRGNLLKISPFDEETFLSLVHSVGSVSNGRVSGRDFEAEVVSSGEGLISYRGDVGRLKGLIARSACTGCGVCGEYCEFGAIEIRERARIHPDRCTKCGVCNEVCPLSFYKDEVVDWRLAADAQEA